MKRHVAQGGEDMMLEDGSVVLLSAGLAGNRHVLAQPPFRVLANSDGPLDRGASHFRPRFAAFRGRAPLGVVVCSLASGRVDTDGVVLERPDLLLVNVTGTAREARGPDAGAVAKHTARRLVLLAR